MQPRRAAATGAEAPEGEFPAMQTQIARRVQILLTLAILVAATYLLGVAWSFLSQFIGTFMLFFFGWLLAYLFKPLVKKITGAGLPFWAAVLIVYIIGP